MYTVRPAILLAATLLLGCTSEPTGFPLDDPSFSVNDQTVPFKATLEGVAQNPTGVVCPIGSFAGSFSLTGHASHMGKITGDGSGCTAFTGPGTFVFLASTNRLVAANGDELWLTLASGSGAVVGFGPNGPKLAWTAQKDVTGGTGRFAGATGHVTETGTQDGFTAPSVAVLEGRISRVGAR